MFIFKPFLKIIKIIFWLFIAGVIFIYGFGFYLAPQDKLEKADAIVAISGGETQARTKEAVNLYQNGWAPKIIFSGAAEEGPSNALAMKRIALSLGMIEEDIVLEEKAASTYENALFTKPILENLGAKKIILVTSPYHQRRAYLSFKKTMPETEIINHSAKDSTWRKKGWWQNPKSLWLTSQESLRIIYLHITKNYK